MQQRLETIMGITGLNKVPCAHDNKSWLRVLVCSVLVLFCFAVFCQIHYSDGDDAFFEEATASVSYLDYLKVRYMSWTGRLGAESLIYFVFRCGGIWFWRLVNAFAVVALPLTIYRLAQKTALKKIPAGRWVDVRGILFVMTGYLLMDVMTFGHAAVWVNGSIVYTWCALCGAIALFPAASCLAKEERSIGGFGIAGYVLCSIVASLSVEQIGLVLLIFLMAALIFRFKNKQSLDRLLLMQVCIVCVALAVSYVAPGNAVRVASEIERWMPSGYVDLSLGNRLFLTVQWLVSSLANEGRLFLLIVWVLGTISLWKKQRKLNVWIILSVVYSIAALLSFLGASIFSSMGLEHIDPAVPVEKLPSWNSMTAIQRFAFFWWSSSLVYTVPFLWKSSGKSFVLLAAFVAGILSEALMFFSPTIYASGERVYYITSLLLLFIATNMFVKLEEDKRNAKTNNFLWLLVLVLGIVNSIVQIPVILSKLG